jgi:hypothetical protein
MGRSVGAAGMNADIQSTCPHRWIDISIYEVPERARYVCMNCRAQWEGEPGKCPCHPEEKRSAWTTEKPLAGEPLFYWIRNYRSVCWAKSVSNHPGPELVLIELMDGVPWIVFVQYGHRRRSVDMCGVPLESVVEAEWAGPLEPPT